MPQTGDTVHVHYTGRLDDGTEFDSSRDRDPLSFTLGAGQVIGGFDTAVAALELGGSTTVRIEPADAYGEISDDLFVRVDRPEDMDGLAEGMRVQLANGAQATVAEIDDKTIVLDGNHQLAGKALTFDLELVSVD